MMKWKARTETINIGIMELDNFTFNEDYLEVSIDICDMSEELKAEVKHRRITAWLETYYGFYADRNTVLSRMQDIGIQAIYPRQNTSKKQPGNKIYPYLLKNVKASYPDHVWSIDITYIPIQKSWLYLVAVIDWYSRYVLAWELDDTLEISFVLEACRSAIRDSNPVIMNSDQGSHFTSPRYTEIFKECGSQISMDHRGRAYDNYLSNVFGGA